MEYSREQLEKVWNGVKYKEDRYWAFMMKGGSWRHSDSKYNKQKTFGTFDEFERYVRAIDAQDVHVKMLINGSREWVIDVDHDTNNQQCVALKNMIAHSTFARFFGSNITRIMYSGNRGLHIWLDCCQFDLNAERSVRKYYYETVLAPPSKNNIGMFTQAGSLNDCFMKSFENSWIKREIATVYPHIKLSDKAALVKEFFPYVDKQVFVSTKQIRAPYSYNSKGQKFSCDHVLLFE
uniref:LEF-1 n=1 Tax=Cydia pomonella granulosis virus TaxID=28289 RepID=A0A097P148_GVCP|nr:ORF74 lef-1 [Cydia pomonella granulovirus]AIU36857.1 ORF74 lef-1 [Cydia pomonella granulovirus]QDW81133.1 lef-1 [Cydia pomonella granulovirus]QGY99462.1 LEF-1 [Cydia pomonella granulovirus]QGY99886.1 LEF-1 [Cydia pomonella granulovirus]